MAEICQRPEFPPTMIFRPRLQNIFEENFRLRKIIFVSAHTGWGKSIAVAEWLEQKNHEFAWFCLNEEKKDTVMNDLLSEISSGESKKIIVIDNYNVLKKEELAQMNLIIIQSARRFVIISRAILPKELAIYVGLSIYLVGIDQLKFTEEETKEYFEKWNISLNNQEISQLASNRTGWVLSYRIIASLMKSTGESYTKEVKLKGLEAVYQYFDVEIFDKWTDMEKEVILTIGCFEQVTAAEANLLLGSLNAHRILENFILKAGFLTFILPDVYVIHSFFKKYLIYKRNIVFSKAKINEIYKFAGSYFENNKDHTRALECYMNASEHEGVIRILIELSKYELGQIDLWKNRKYYYELPEERIKKEPALCCGMAMLGIVSFNLDEAERWRAYLEKLLKELPAGDKKRKEVYDNLAYLSIAMPNSSMVNFLNLMKKWAIKVKSGKVYMQKANITWNSPSVVNGGRDFTPWLKKAKMVKDPMDWVVISLYGDYGMGVLDVAVAECYYQQNKIQESLIQIVGAISYIEQKGSIIILFAAMVVQMMIMMLSGQIATAKPMLDNMRDKIKNVKAEFLYPNLDAVSAFVSLYENNYEKIDYWLTYEAPDENAAFSTLDLFRYKVKLRVYILYEKYYLAIGLAEKIRPVYIAFHRKMDLSELDLLLAIVYHRMGQKKNSEEYLKKSLIRGEKYGYIRLFADEGEPLHKILKNIEGTKEISKKYFKQVKDATKKVAMLYPSYLILLNDKEVSLSVSELEVLNLIAQGKSNNEIAEYISISLNTVKFHVKNIFSKLNVKNRFQAVHIAKEKGIIKN